MSSNPFRSKSMERISSPEQLNSYIRISSPSVWLVVAAIALLLLGACVWGICGRMDTLLSAGAVCKGGQVTAYVAREEAGRVQAGMRVRMDGSEGVVSFLAAEPVRVDEGFSDYLCHLGRMQPGEWVYPVAVEINAGEGVHLLQIVVESVSPISFVLN